jgi:hypothetical protein
MLVLKWRLIIVAALTACVLIIAGVVVWQQQYLVAFNWNQNAVQTTALVTDHTTIEQSCTYSCDCRYSCSKRAIEEVEFKYYGGSTCKTRCKTCTAPCYDGYIDTSYKTDTGQQFAEIQIYNDWYNQTDLLNALNNAYPIPSNLSIYYDGRNTTDAELSLKDAAGAQNTFWAIVGTLLVILAGWGVFEAIWNRCIKNNHANYTAL